MPPSGMDFILTSHGWASEEGGSRDAPSGEGGKADQMAAALDGPDEGHGDPEPRR